MSPPEPGRRAPKVLPPIRKCIVVPWTAEAAFRRFTEEIGSWWPTRSHSVGGRDTETVVFEGRVGGRIYERIRGGTDSTWGTVTAWEPPTRVAFTWHPGSKPDMAQSIEVRFLAAGPDGAHTRLELTHSGWERFGALASRVRGGYSIGWGYVLRFWAGRQRGIVVRGIDALTWLLTPVRKLMERRMERQLKETVGS